MAIEWNNDEIRMKLTRLLDHITQLAMADDVMTDDEQEMINVIREHVLSFEERIGQMVEEHDDIEMVTHEIKNIFESAIEAAARQARRDGTITADELILIDRLAKFLRNEDVGSFLQSST